MHFHILFLDFISEILIKISALIHYKIAPFLGANNLLIHLDFVGDIVANTVFAIGVFTFAEMDNVLFVHDATTDATGDFLLLESLQNGATEIADVF